MHIVTFYSYKGGTGRSMALVNVAVELAKSGQRVLIVDFDLEAPGLDTFNLPRPQSATANKGMVEFVIEYLKTGETPDVSQFVYTSNIPTATGKLYVMPAGRYDGGYDERFKSINWPDLYESHDGYLLFEDLKVQWQKRLEVDYVLIDSRTGHTDVGGICTRQLPDSVVLFFFPNEQNRRGLQDVIRQIKGELKTERKRNIKIHFVMSNAPETDDEEGFLAKKVAEFKETLEFKTFAAVIHHYNSPALVTQSIFTLDRPRTRLAEEYRELAKLIRRDNLEDREVALEFLDEMAPLGRQRRFPALEMEDRIKAIRNTHANDPEVLKRLAILLRRQRRFGEALELFERAGEFGAKTADFFLARAELYKLNNNPSAALEDAKRLLETSDATYLEVSAAAKLILELSTQSLESIVEAPAFQKLDSIGQRFVATEFFQSRGALPVAVKILSSLKKVEPANLVLHELVQNDLTLALIGEGHYQEAMKVISPDEHGKEKTLTISEAFNYAMSDWGMNLRPSPELFRKVVELEKDEDESGPNRHECMAIALWAIDQTEPALSRLGESWQQIISRPKPDFSAWSYLRVSHPEFMNDLKEIQRLIEGEAITPRFIRENRSTRENLKPKRAISFDEV
jgi:MinD-like ATPase involved in chromosome partitioning or flagellar assembly